MLKRFLLIFFSAFLLVINIAAQQDKTDRQTADQSLPEELTKPPLDSRYSSGARPFGGAAAFNAYSVIIGQPFRAEVNARSVESEPDGTKIISEYHGIAARDSQGRVFLEQLASPQVRDADGRGAAFNAHAVSVVDPLAKIETKWDDLNKVAYQSTPPFFTNRQPLDRCEMDQAGITAARNYPNDKMQRSESLGERVIQGISTRGCRVYTVISADQSPEKSSFTIIDESWTSPELRVVLLHIRRNPNGENEITQLDNITRREPDAAIFQPPPDYRVLDPKGKDLPTAALNAEKILHPNEFISPISITHQSDSIVMTIDHPRPLQVAVDFLRLKYGWKIDYEEPPDIAELIEAGNSKWFTTQQIKPRPGTLMMAGGSFQSEYAESLAKPTAADGEKQILEKIVADYNRSGNPGKYAVRQESNNRFAIVGVSLKDKDGQDKDVVPILDTPISIPAERRSGWDTIELILSELSKKTGTSVKYFGMADNGLIQSRVVVGGENIPARTLLLQVIGETGTARNWGLLYDTNNGGFYGFNTGGYSIASAPR